MWALSTVTQAQASHAGREYVAMVDRVSKVRAASVLQHEFPREAATLLSTASALDPFSVVWSERLAELLKEHPQVALDSTERSDVLARGVARAQEVEASSELLRFEQAIEALGEGRLDDAERPGQGSSWARQLITFWDKPCARAWLLELEAGKTPDMERCQPRRCGNHLGLSLVRFR